MDGVDVVLERRARARRILRISGRLRPGWCGNLADGLAGRGIGIVRGHAVMVSAGTWHAEFELDCMRGTEPTPEQLGCLLDTEARAGFTTPIELLGFRLEDSETRGGCLRLEVEGRDRVGFLAALLRRLAYFSLFPVELDLETSGERVQDRLWLRGGGASVPRPATRAALAASLQALAARDMGAEPPRPAQERPPDP
jgi:hypothetical protein